MNRVIIIGAGASGLMAGAAAARCGGKVLVLEKNEKAGKKIYITGKGRGNLTNACETMDFFEHIVRNPKFMFSSVYGFDQQEAVRFFEKYGCTCKVERGNRVFPVSDHASDITRALLTALREHGGDIQYRTEVTEILQKEGRVTGVSAGGKKIFAEAVILCSGGMSYPVTGSDGGGYTLAEKLGHTIIPAAPSLVPFNTQEDWCRDLQGLALKNVELTVFPEEEEKSGQAKRKKNRPVYQGFGEMLFTHFGISGPLVLTASCYCDFSKHRTFRAFIDMKPALNPEQLMDRLRRELEAAPGRKLENIMRTMFPARLSEVMVHLSGLGRERTASSIQPAEAEKMVSLIKAVPVTLLSTRSFHEAIITRGGVNVREVDPSTMESRLVKGLYFAGEILDVDAHTGGYNLQIAWSTGHLAGESAAESL